MIVAIGIAVDDTFQHFVASATRAGYAVRAIDLLRLVAGEWRFDVPARGAAALSIDGERVLLDPADAFYCRIIDLSPFELDPTRARRWQALTTALRAWLESVPGVVANRGEGAAHNRSKPLHERILREFGFSVPASLTTSDRQSLLEFVRGGSAISKTVCGVRADAILVGAADFANFEPESGPVHVQRFVSGRDVRIHVIGDRLVAQRTSRVSVDYRRDGGLQTLERFEPSPELGERLIHATRSLGLVFAGWDFKIDDAEHFWCLEVNPMPGYLPYDRRCEGAITRELAGHLAQGERAQ